MYISPWLQAALIPQRWDVCGIICPPLTVWAHYVLRTSRNAYMTGGANPSKDAAAEVLLYASRTHAEGAALYWQDRKRVKALRQLHKQLAPQAVEDVDKAVAEYVFECLRAPTHEVILASTKRDTVKSEPVKAPLEWVIVEYLTGGDPAKLEAAWNTGFSAALCLFDAGRDARGADNSLISEQRERELDEREEKELFDGRNCTA